MKNLLSISAVLFCCLCLRAQHDALLVAYEWTVTVAQVEDMYKAGFFEEDREYALDHRGRPHGRFFDFYESGDMYSSGFYQEGEKHGPWIFYYNDGSRHARGCYKHGQRDGKWLVWDQQGALQLEMRYRDGRKVGCWTLFNQDGSVLEKRFFGL